MSQTLVAGVGQMGEILPNDHLDPQFVDYFAMLVLVARSVIKNKRNLIPKLIIDRAIAINSISSASEDKEYREDWRSSLLIKNESLRDVYRSCEVYEQKIKLQRKVLPTGRNYVGLGPLRMQEGDTICLIYGAKVPFLVRKRLEGGYILVGEDYINGLMHGEGMSIGVEEDLILY